MEELLHSTYTWITVAFVIFVALFIKLLMPVIGKSLDARADKIRDQLELASRLRAEAAELLASYQRQREERLKAAEHIVTQAHADAELLRKTAEADLAAAIDRRRQQAEEKIARAEAEAIASIRLRMIDIAGKAAEQIIGAQLSAQKDDPAVEKAIATIGRQQMH